MVWPSEVSWSQQIWCMWIYSAVMVGYFFRHMPYSKSISKRLCVNPGSPSRTILWHSLQICVWGRRPNFAARWLALLLISCNRSFIACSGLNLCPQDVHRPVKCHKYFIIPPLSGSLGNIKGNIFENCIDNGTAKFLAKPDKPKGQISGWFHGEIVNSKLDLPRRTQRAQRKI